jgi:hypothetical protein
MRKGTSVQLRKAAGARTRRLRHRLSMLLLAVLLGGAQTAILAQPSLESGSVLAAAERLKAGEFLWAPEVAPEGPVLVVVSLATQRAVIYRNGLPIGISTVSSGRPGHRTPTGIFTVLQRREEHYSSIYNRAPMPYMQRLTWGGVALHGGHLPGYPASHGCIRLPHEFARLLYSVTRLGMTVVVTNDASIPRVAPADILLGDPAVAAVAVAIGESWHPERSRTGPVSIVISATERRVIVIRNGIVIGAAPVTISAPIDATSVFMLQEGPQRQWLRIILPGQSATTQRVELRGHINVSMTFRAAVEGVIRPGTIVVVTSDALRGEGRQSTTLIEGTP